MLKCARKMLDTADIVRDAMLRQLASDPHFHRFIRLVLRGVLLPRFYIVVKAEGDRAPSFRVVTIPVAPEPGKRLQYMIQCLRHSDVVQLAGHARLVGDRIGRKAPPSPGNLRPNIALHEIDYLRSVQDSDHSHTWAVIVSREREMVNVDMKEVCRDICLHHANFSITLLSDPHLRILGEHLLQNVTS